MDAFTPFGRIQKKLPIAGQAIVEFLARTGDVPPGRFKFALFVFDTETGNMGHTSDVERGHLHAMLAEHLSHQAN